MNSQNNHSFYHETPSMQSTDFPNYTPQPAPSANAQDESHFIHPHTAAHQPSGRFEGTSMASSSYPQRNSFSLSQHSRNLLSHPPDYSEELKLAQTIDEVVSNAAQRVPSDSAFSPPNNSLSGLPEGSASMEHQSRVSEALEPFRYPLPTLYPPTDLGEGYNSPVNSQSSGLTYPILQPGSADLSTADLSINVETANPSEDNDAMDSPTASSPPYKPREPNQTVVKLTDEELMEKARLANKIAQRKYRSKVKQRQEELEARYEFQRSRAEAADSRNVHLEGLLAMYNVPRHLWERSASHSNNSVNR